MSIMSTRTNHFAMIKRIAITSQMTASNRMAPMIWLREKRMNVISRASGYGELYFPSEKTYVLVPLADFTFPLSSSSVPVVETLRSK